MKNYQVTYIDGIGNEISILIKARNEIHCRQIFRKRYGMYHIVKITELN